MSKEYIIVRETKKYSGTDLDNILYYIDATKYMQYVGYVPARVWKEVFNLPEIDGKYKIIVQDANN